MIIQTNITNWLKNSTQMEPALISFIRISPIDPLMFVNLLSTCAAIILFKFYKNEKLVKNFKIKLKKKEKYKNKTTII